MGTGFFFHNSVFKRIKQKNMNRIEKGVISYLIEKYKNDIFTTNHSMENFKIPWKNINSAEKYITDVIEPIFKIESDGKSKNEDASLKNNALDKNYETVFILVSEDSDLEMTLNDTDVPGTATKIIISTVKDFPQKIVGLFEIKDMSELLKKIGVYLDDKDIPEKIEMIKKRELDLEKMLRSEGKSV